MGEQAAMYPAWTERLQEQCHLEREARAAEFQALRAEMVASSGGEEQQCALEAHSTYCEAQLEVRKLQMAGALQQYDAEIAALTKALAQVLMQGELTIR